MRKRTMFISAALLTATIVTGIAIFAEEKHNTLQPLSEYHFTNAEMNQLVKEVDEDVVIEVGEVLGSATGREYVYAFADEDKEFAEFLEKEYQIDWKK